MQSLDPSPLNIDISVKIGLCERREYLQIDFKICNVYKLIYGYLHKY